MKRRFDALKVWARRNRRLLLRVGGGLVIFLLVVQVFYPGDRMPLYATVDGKNVSAWNKQDAAWQLDAMSANQRIDVMLGDAGETYDTPKPAEIGLKVSNEKRITGAGYPWYLRVVPTSLFWFGLLQSEKTPSYSVDEARSAAYLNEKLGESCNIPPKDATLELKNSTLTVVKAKSGGTCREADAIKAIASVKPRLNQPAAITIPVDVTAPNVGDDEAKKLADELNKNSQSGVKLAVAGSERTIEQKEVLSWLDFKTEGEALGFVINPDKANVYMAKAVTPGVSKPAGVTKVSTLDFTETARSDGATGQTIALTQTLAGISSVLKGDKKSATTVVAPLPPKVEYTRSYTKTSTGIAAQIKFYDEDNKGIFGVSFQELGGQGLSAQHNASQSFVTASTYKLFVAFSTLKRIDAGTMKLTDANIASGRDLSTCFNDMIVKSDNACAEALIKKIGAKELNADIKSIGLGSTAFKSDNNVTTASDLATYLTKLEKGELPLKPESRTRLLDAMKRNVYRQGVPSGASGQTADKVGFLFGLLHDAAIVYSPKGTYVLAVMSDGSSWAAIADLTRKIEALR